MARERELTGIVRPKVDETEMDREVGKLDEAMERASNITPDLSLSRARRKLRSLTPGGAGGALGGILGGGAAASAVGDDDVQEQQLNELQEIRRTLSKEALSEGGGGGGLLQSLGIAGVLSTLGGVGAGAGGLGILGSFFGGQGSQMAPEERQSRIQDLRESAVDLIGFDPKKKLKNLQLPAPLKNFEWPSLPSLPTPLKNFDWPSLPELPAALRNFEWPELQAPPWVRDIMSFINGRGGQGGQGSLAGRRALNTDAERGPGASNLDAGGNLTNQPGGAQVQFNIDAVIEDLDRQLDRFKQDLKDDVMRELSRQMTD